jgi:hypothetical protein
LRRRPLAERRPTGATARLHSVTLKKKATFGIPDDIGLRLTAGALGAILTCGSGELIASRSVLSLGLAAKHNRGFGV